MASHKIILPSETDIISAFIVDDEIGAIKTLRQMLKEYCPWVKVIGDAITINDAVQAVTSFKPDVVFLDIEMPPLGNGFDFLNNCENEKFGVIFTTAYPQYAIYAINSVQPWSYLIKPFSVSELATAVHIAIGKVANKHQPSEITATQQGLILHDRRKGTIVLQSNDILFCKAEGSFTDFYIVKNGKVEKITSCGYLGEFEAKLSSTLFCRVHHSYLINLIYVERVVRTGRNGIIYFKNTDLKANISVSRMKHFNKHLNTFSRIDQFAGRSTVR